MIFGITAPASPIVPSQLQKAISSLTDRNIEVRIGEHIAATHGYFAGTLDQRISDLKRFIDKPEVDVIWIARGGHGCFEVAQKLASDEILKNSKPRTLIGYSDATCLFEIFKQHGWRVIHGTMPGLSQFMNNNESVFSAMRGEPIIRNLTYSNKISKIIQGELVGGNLTAVASLCGTPLQFNFTDKLAFFETNDVTFSTAHRLLNQIIASSNLVQAKAIIFGDFHNVRDVVAKIEFENISTPTREPMNSIEGIEFLIKSLTNICNVPIFTGLDIGHGAINNALDLSRTYKIQEGALRG